MGKNVEPGLAGKAVPIIGRAHLDASGARESGDRIKIAGILAKKLLVIDDEPGFKAVMEVINDEIKFNTGDRGMQHDFSFHHRVDRVNNTTSYGLGYADAFAEWAYYVSGTKYAFSTDRMEQLIDYYLDGICKQYIYGVYKETGVQNRGISRKATFRPQSPATPARLASISDYRRDELLEIVMLRKGEAEPSLSFATFFWQTEHFAFQRPDFYTSVRMYSTRNASMEYPHNREGIYNHHRGDGTSHLAIKGDEYLNIWPVYDWQKIPGTTVLQKPELPSEREIQKYGVTDFVGAITDGLYGAVAFDFISAHDFTKARKSWFFFDHEYVCLGAGIVARSLHPVATTLEQSLLKGDVIVCSRGATRTPKPGDHELSGVNWVHHNGIGYMFPEAADVHLSNKEESGTWYDINKQWRSSKEPEEKGVFKLWINHGVRPQGRPGGLRHGSMLEKDVTYAYMVVPHADPENMDDDRGIKILANNRMMQAVLNTRLGICQAVFYEAGELEISDDMVLSLDSPAAVMVKLTGHDVESITVSDPSRKLARLHLKISGNFPVNEKHARSRFDGEKSMSEVTVELPGGPYAGQSVVVE
jgi:chondroitin AC lyase